MNVSVDAEALRSVLTALIGPSHLIRELIVIDRLTDFEESAISKLIRQFNEQVPP